MKILLLLLTLSLALFASIGQISSLKGIATVTRGTEVLAGKVGLQLEEKDIVKTQEKSKLQIIFKDGTIVTIGKSSNFNIYDYVYDTKQEAKDKVSFGFLKGSFKSITGKIGKIAPSRFKLKTSTATIGIRGTTVVGNQNAVACTYGKIVVSAYGVTVEVPAGMISQTPPNAPPTQAVPYKNGTIDGDIEQSNARRLEKKEDKTESKLEKKEQKKETPMLSDQPEQEVTQAKAIPTTDVVDDVVTVVNTDTKDTEENKVVKDTITTTDTLSNISTIASQTTTSNLDTLLATDSSLTKSQVYSDSYLQYGYWNDASDTSVGTYVTGTTTSSEIINQMILNQNPTATYSGGLSAIVTTTDGTQRTSDGTVNFDIDFVDKSFNGNVNVTQGNFKANIAGTVGKYGFDATSVTTASGDSAGVTGGALNGKFYGADAQAVGGTFKLNSSTSGTANGIFGATKVAR